MKLKKFFHLLKTGVLSLVLVFLTTALAPGVSSAAEDLPVVVPDLPPTQADVRNQVTFSQIHNIVGPDDAGKGLTIDLEDTTLFGTVYTGPYPFEAGDADYDYSRYRKSSALDLGTGTLSISDFFKDKYNANSWPQGIWPMTTTIGYRLDLYRDDQDGCQHLGFYEGVVSFQKEGDTYLKNLTITEGPFVTMVRSDDPTTLTLAWETDEVSRGVVYAAQVVDLTDLPPFWRDLYEQSGVVISYAHHQYVIEYPVMFSESESTRNHEVELTGLQPASTYLYTVLCTTESGDSVLSNLYSLETAPEAGEGSATLAFAGDSREGVGGGERNYMGSNFRILSQLSMDANREGADFFIFGGDLVNGYTSDTEDFALQLKGWKQAMAGFWRSHPVYPGMGNHETLLNAFDDGSNYGIVLDKWPYETSSAEALFAQEFHNPTNGLEPSDPRRPQYTENVYSFQYGPLLAIAFNNNYWYTSNSKVPEYGGSPEGYIMEDQLEWIEQTLAQAEGNPSIRYIVLYAQEPVFPCGGHIKDAMWWNGNNNIRAYTRHGDHAVPEAMGIIEVRNRFWEAVAESSKVAAVLTADEHEYHRTLITSETPVGVYPADDTDGDGVLDQYSPHPGFAYPTWHITVGTGGAPYYSREDTPWQPEILSSQHGYALIHADEQGISLKFISITGQVVDDVPDLMAVK